MSCIDLKTSIIMCDYGLPFSLLSLFFYLYISKLNSMIRQESQFDKESEEQSGLNYQSKKLLHMISLQILDIESTLHYIQKKHTMHQLKEALSQIYTIFNQTEPLFKIIKGFFLHQEIKKIMNCFGIIYVILMDHLHNDKKKTVFEPNDSEDLRREQKEQNQQLKQSQTIQNAQNTELKPKPRPLGGIHLYNERFSRHLQSDEQLRKTNTAKMIKQPTKQELKKMVTDEINDNSHLNSKPQETLDIFSFKFKYGKENQIVTFHDELLSIANFFKQSQNEAFQFLNKTKDQTSIISYNDSFRDIMCEIKKEKDEKLKNFTDKIKLAFTSIKSKTEKKMAEIENKLTNIEETKRPKTIDRLEKQVQTTFNFDEEIKSLKRRLADSQEKYKIMMDFKKKELEENTMIGLQLESEIGLKNREIVYLKLNVEENQLLVSNLSKRIKFVTETNRRYKDIVKNNEEPSKLLEIVQNKEETDSFNKEEEDNQLALESLRKQRKMAKKILLDKRKSSFMEEKSTFMKRFTQQLDASTPKNILSRNLSEIFEGEGSEMYDSDNASMISNKNNLISEDHVRTYVRKQTKKVSIANVAQGGESSHSIKSHHQFSKSKKLLKEKRTSELLDHSNRTSLLNKLNHSPPINEDSILDECSEQQQNFINGKQESLNINSEQFNKIEEMFKNQMNRTKNIIGNNKRFSSFSNKGNNKSYFSQKQHTEESLPTVNRSSNRGKYSFRGSHQDEDKKSSVNRASNKNDGFPDDKHKTSIEIKNKVEQMSNTVKSKLNLCSAQVFMSIYTPKSKIEEQMQTSQKRFTTDPDEETEFSQQNTYSNYVYIPKIQQTILTNETQTNSELVTRSATQSKISKSRHLKTLYTNKQNEKYIFPFVKETEKSVDDGFKHSQSCLDMQVDVQKELEKAEEAKKAIEEQIQKAKEEQQMRKLAIKCRTLQQFKARIAQIHKKKCGHNCRHLQKFVQNYIKYKQQNKPKMKITIKNMCDNINYTSTEQEQKNYFPMLQKKKF